MKKITLVLILLVSISFTNTTNAQNGDPFIGEIVMFGGNFAPRGWAFCDGQLLAISSNTALFSILGTTYGGDGRVTFGLPDLRGRVAIHAGSGPGLSPRPLGQKSGSQTSNVTLTPTTAKAINTRTPGATFIDAVTGVQAQPVNTMQPYTVVNYIIALQGTFPSRN